MGKHLILFVALSTSFACTESDGDSPIDKVKAQAGEALAAARSTAGDAKENYIRQLRLRIAALTARITALENAAKSKGAAAQAKVQDQIDVLDEKRAALQDKLEALESKTGDAWDSAKSGVEDALGELEEAYDDVKETLE